MKHIILFYILLISLPAFPCDIFEKYRGTEIICEDYVGKNGQLMKKRGLFGDLQLTAKEWDRKAEVYCKDHCDLDERYHRAKTLDPDKYEMISKEAYWGGLSGCGVKNINLGTDVAKFTSTLLRTECQDGRMEEGKSECDKPCSEAFYQSEYNESKKRHPEKYREVSLEDYTKNRGRCGVKKYYRSLHKVILEYVSTVGTEPKPGDTNIER